MKNARIVSSNLGSEEGSAPDIPKMVDSQEFVGVPSTPKCTVNSENRSRYSMNYQSYEATRIQPGEQTRRMLDYMFPGYQKRDPRNWYEMQTQTDLEGSDVNGLIGTELMEGEPIESYEDRKKSFGDSFGDDTSDSDGPTFEKKTATKKGHRSSVLSRVWEGPPIKMSGKSSQEGFHLEVDDHYHEPQTILVPRDIIEHQELKMDIVPDDQGVPKVVIYLGNRDPSDLIVKEQPDETIVLFDGKEDFNGTTSDESTELATPEKSLSPVIESVDVTEVTSEDLPEPEEPLTIRDSLEVVLPNVMRTEPEPPERDSSLIDSEESSSDHFLQEGRMMNNSVFLEPIKATGSHTDVYEDVIEPRIEEPLPPIEEPTPSPPKEPTPPPREPSPPPEEPSPPLKDLTPPPKEPIPPPKEPPLVESPESVSLKSLLPESYLPPQESPPPHVVPEKTMEDYKKTPPRISTASMPSQTSNHIGSPPDHLFGPLENYPDDMDEESDKIIHTPSPQLPGPSKDEEIDHPLSLTDDYPPQYSPPPREGSDVSNWLEASILSQARNVSIMQKSAVAKLPVSNQEQKLEVTEIAIQDLQPEEAQISTQQPQPQISIQERDYEEDKPKLSKAARFRDDERLSNPRALEERFSIYYPPPKSKKRKGDQTREVLVDNIEDHDQPDVKEEDHHLADVPDSKVVAPDVPKVDGTSDNKAEDKSVDEWLEDEILNPAAVDDWVDTKIISESKKSQQPERISLHSGPAKPVDKESELVDAWIESEILQSAQVDNWVTNKIMKPGEKLSCKKEQPATKPVATIPVTAQPSPSSFKSVSTASSDSGTSGQPLDDYANELKQPNLVSKPAIAAPPQTRLAPPAITSPPTTLPRERRESSDKSFDVNEMEVDSWIANELLGPAEADAWLEKKVIQPAQAEKWVDHQVIKPASVISYVDETIMQPSAVESCIDDKITEPAKAESYVYRNNVKSAEAESWIDSNVNGNSDVPFERPAPVDSLHVAFKTSKESTPVEMVDKKVRSEMPLAKDSRIGERPKRFQMPETCISDTNLMSPFQPHPDCPDEFPRDPSGVQLIVEPAPQPKAAKPVADSTKELMEDRVESSQTPVEDKSETSDTHVQKYPTVGKPKTTSDTEMPKYPSILVEKSPVRSPHASLISIDRKPSLKQKSDSGNISKLKLHNWEPEKRDRSSILAKKAMENDNYLLRDEEDEYIHPELRSNTNDLGKKRKSSTSSKKCPLSNLFKKKRSSSPGPSIFVPPTGDKQGLSEEEGSRKCRKALSSIDEEEFSSFKPPETVKKKPESSINLVPPSSQQTKLDGTSKTPSGSIVKSGGEHKESTDGLPFSSISTTTYSNDYHTTPLRSTRPPLPSAFSVMQSPQSQSKVISPSEVASPSQVASSSLTTSPSPGSLPIQTAPPFQAALPAQHFQLIMPLGPEVAARNESQKIQTELYLVMPEELDITFPKFPDYEEAMNNQKKPEKDAVKKSVPNPPKGGFPMFPDYKQLTEPQSEYDEPSLKKDPVEEHSRGVLVNKPKKTQDDERLKGQVPTNGFQSKEITTSSSTKDSGNPLKASAVQGDLQKEKTLSKDVTETKTIPSINQEELWSTTDTFLEGPKEVKQFEPRKDLEKNMMVSPTLEPSKTNVKSKSYYSAEPKYSGNGVPIFPDYNEITLGPQITQATSLPEQMPGTFDQREQPHAPPFGILPPQESVSSPYKDGPPYSDRQIPFTYQTQQPISVGSYASLSPQTAALKQDPGASTYETIQPQESISRPYSPDQSQGAPLHQNHPHASVQLGSLQKHPQDPAIKPLGLFKIDEPLIRPYTPSQPTQAQPFKKYNYSQPDKPLQRVSTPLFESHFPSQPDKLLQPMATPGYASVQQLKPSSDERGGYHSQQQPYNEVSSSQKQMPSGDHMVHHPSSLGLPDGAVPQFPQDSPPTTSYGVDRPPVSSSPYESGQRQQKGLRRTDQNLHQCIPSPEGYLSIKQRPAPQSLSSAVTPLGHGQPQGPNDSYSGDPHYQTYGPDQPGPKYGVPSASSHRPLPGFTEQAVSPYSESQLKESNGSLSSPYTRETTTSTEQPLAPGYSPYRPMYQQSPYVRPSASTSKAPPSTHQLPQQSPHSPAITSRPGGGSPTLKKHTYSHPEQPLPLTPVRPPGLKDDDGSPQREGFNTSVLEHQKDRLTRQTTPVEPGGGVPLFPDFEEAFKHIPKPPTMTGDFKRVAPKPKTVTAEDKKAEFDKEIFPIMEQIRDLKRQMYELTPERGSPMKTGPVQSGSLPSSLQLYNELEKRTLAATKADREEANAQRRKQVYEENARRKIQRAIERYVDYKGQHTRVRNEDIDFILLMSCYGCSSLEERRALSYRAFFCILLNIYFYVECFLLSIIDLMGSLNLIPTNPLYYFKVKFLLTDYLENRPLTCIA